MKYCSSELILINYEKKPKKAIVKEIQGIGSEDLLLWSNPDNPILSSAPNSSYGGWFNLSTAFNTLNSTLEKVLQFEEDSVDTHF